MLERLLKDSRYSISCTLKSKRLVLERLWDGNICRSKLINNTDKVCTIDEIKVFEIDMPFDEDTFYYGEGYTMLSQNYGTIKKPQDVTPYTDSGHYKLKSIEGMTIVYNLICFSKNNQHDMLAFTSCNRFSGHFCFNAGRLQVIINTERLNINPGESWDLEEFIVLSGDNINCLYKYLGERIQHNYSRLTEDKIPTGWCSWYCYGPDISEEIIINNLNSIKEKNVEIKYIQIDDGYQKHMGDWLVQGDTFKCGIKALCKIIKDKGFEPAIWVAPFIAEQESQLFKDHPDWFVKDAEGKPLPSDRVSFGGWRNAPWYMLDGTHPEVCSYLKQLFKTMVQEWDCRYFKLDANVWGALPFGNRFNKTMTCVEAYRMGMKAILEGAGEDSFILGCNAAMWPSLGLVHGMRITGDVARSWDTFSGLAKECFYRNWQNNALWVNDPDCIVINHLDTELIAPDGDVKALDKTVTEDEFLFHATHIIASGGMLLSGDNFTIMQEQKVNILKKSIPPIGVAAIFDDTTFSVGKIELDNKLIICLFNWGEVDKDMEVCFQGSFEVFDFWQDKGLGKYNKKIDIKNIKPHSAKLLVCEPVTD